MEVQACVTRILKAKGTQDPLQWEAGRAAVRVDGLPGHDMT